MRIGIGIGIDNSGPISSGAALPIVSDVTITGTAVVGQTLTCDGGTVTGTEPITKTYQWYRGATLIGGATNSNYTSVQADAGNTSNIKCVVTATNSAGSASADSNTIARILDTLTNNYITGLTLTSAEIDSFNTLYLALRTNNYHTEIDRLHIYASATNNAANKSLFGAFTAIPVNSPTFTRKIGYTMTGTSYIRTSWIPSVNANKFTLNANLIQIRVDRASTANAMFTGVFDGHPYFLFWTANTLSIADLGAQVSNVFTGLTTANKLFAVKRTDVANVIGYMDASTSAKANTRLNSLPAIEVFDGGRNLSGAPNLLMANNDKILYSLNASSAVDVATIDTIINNFITSL